MIETEAAPHARRGGPLRRRLASRFPAALTSVVAELFTLLPPLDFFWVAA